MRSGMDNATDICPKCDGTGRAFCQIDESHRTEMPCPICKGSGKGSDALAMLLCMDPADKAELDKKAKEFADYSWQGKIANW